MFDKSITPDDCRSDTTCLKELLESFEPNRKEKEQPKKWLTALNTLISTICLVNIDYEAVLRTDFNHILEAKLPGVDFALYFKYDKTKQIARQEQSNAQVIKQHSAPIQLLESDLLDFKNQILDSSNL